MSVRLETDDRGVPLVLLDRPSRRNAINMDMIDGIREGVRSAGPVLILGSTDRRAFSSGADLDLEDPARAGVSDALYSLYQEMRDSETVLVAAADGYAWGGGAQLLLACDLRIGGPDLNIRFMGLGHGLVVGAWGLPELIGRGRAVELCLTMRSVGAEEALRIGLVERVVAEPLEEAANLASSMLRVDPRSLAGVKRVVSNPDPMSALNLERELNSSWDGSMPQRSDG
jgi:enoyl-CoA hydratase/carnithine racemase